MTQIYVKYNPYKLETKIEINGREISIDSSLYKLTKGKRLQEWIIKFPEMLREELNSIDFSLTYFGSKLDYDDFVDAFNQATEKNVINKPIIKFIEGKNDEDINGKIVAIFRELQAGPIDDFRDVKLNKAFENVNNSIFPVNVIATMSSGKSTLINALLAKKLMPSKNEACTATITEIIDSDNKDFSAVVFDKDDNIIKEIQQLTYDTMSELNSDDNVNKIVAEGDIGFLDSRNTALMLVDTPGPNNAQNQAHKNTTYRAINNDSNNLILYVLNGTQLSTNDDAELLKYISEQIQKGGKQVRDRFLFVINKMDQFNPEEESIESAINAAKNYLAKYKINDPQIFPCSAFTALSIKTELTGIDINHLTRAQEKMLPMSARDALVMIDKFDEFESMHLEKYSTLSPSAQEELNIRLKKAIENDDIKERVLIHSGICSIEAAITAYVKKYAKTKKIKDLVESFQEVLESNEVLTKAKTKVATDEATAKACAERSAIVRQKISDGREATIFKEKIENLNPLPIIEAKAEELKIEANESASKIFNFYGETITSREEAKRLVGQFLMASSDAMAKMTTELESVINSEIVDTGEQLLLQYQEKLIEFDEADSESQLDFNTVDLIKGALKTVRENVKSWATSDIVTETVDDYGVVSYEEKTYYDKVGQVEEEIVVGSHKEKTGTKRVKTGTERVFVGKRTVENPDKRWWKIFTPKYIEEDVYETRNLYKDEDIFETVLDYKTVMRDIYEERVEKIEKFTIGVSIIQQVLISKIRRNLDEGVERALDYADEQIVIMKNQFYHMFNDLDMLIAEKYVELEQCASDESKNAERLQRNIAILKWIEENMIKIESILEM